MSLMAAAHQRQRDGSVDFYDATAGQDLGSAPVSNGVAIINVTSFNGALPSST